MLKKIKKHLVWILIATTVVAVWFLLSSLKNGGTNGKGAIQRFTVEPKEITSVLSLSGSVDADEKATLQFQTSGQLTWVGVKEGDWVEKWQAVASLDQRALKQDLQKKLYDFMDTRWDHDQLKDDYQSQETDGWNIYLTDEITRIAQQSQFGLNKAVIDVELSQLTIDLSTLISPIAGIVTQIDQPVSGVNITPATARIEVVNPDTLFLKVIVDQQDVVKLKQAMRAQIVFDSFPNETYQGSVYYISFKPATGEDSSYLIKISLATKLKDKLRLGMAAEISLVTGRKSGVLAVPFAAINQESSGSYVTIVDSNNKQAKRRVTTGIESDEYVEIKQGLQKGEVVVY